MEIINSNAEDVRQVLKNKQQIIEKGKITYKNKIKQEILENIKEAKNKIY